VQAKDWPAFAKATGIPDLISDARFADEKARVANSLQLTEILDRAFASQPLAQWRSVLDQANVTYGVVRHPSEAITDPQLLANDIIVPLEGAGENLKQTISSPIKIHGVAKVPARRAPDLGEHNDEVLTELGFSSREIEGLRANGTIPPAQQRSIAAD
jgi:formyl-CoA transferase